ARPLGALPGSGRALFLVGPEGGGYPEILYSFRGETSMKLRLSFGISPKLLLTMLVVTLIPLGAIWYLDYRSESQKLSTHVEQPLSGHDELSEGYAAGSVEMHLGMLRQNAALQDMLSMAGKNQTPPLRAIAAEYKWVYLAFPMAPDGNNVGRNGEGP